MALIDNPFNVNEGVAISYGLKIGIREPGALDYRNRLGFDVLVEGVDVGNIEIDISSNSTYQVEIADMLKNYILPDPPVGFPSPDVFTMIPYNAKLITLKPYFRSKPIDADWAARVYGTSVDFTAVRGIDKRYITDNMVTPVVPLIDTLQDKKVFEGQTEYVYLTLPSGVNYYYGYEGVVKTYDINDSLVDEHNFSINSKSDNNIIAMGAFERQSPTIVKAVVTAEYIEYERSSDGVLGTTTKDFTISYVCSQNNEYAVTLTYLDVDFLWKTIPFFLKNPNNFSREVQTAEGYDYAKRDYNLKVRRTMDLKSDYLNKTAIDELATFGLASKFYVVFEDRSTTFEVRLLNNTMPVYSAWNMAMTKMEVQVELSKLIPTA